MRVCVIQMSSVDDKAANLAQARGLIEEAVREDRPDLVLLPEVWAFQGGSLEQRREAAETIPGGEAYGLLQELAAAHGIFVHGGSFLERGPERLFNTTVVFGRDGEEIARYRKLHLFDVVTPDGREYRESATVGRGTEVVTYPAEDLRVGCSICYDLRFGELYRRLAAEGAQLLTVPAAFTLQTGKDHWEVLLRARAIENQCYVIAPAQCGEHPGGRLTYGRSMIVDPWGLVLARAADRPGPVFADCLAEEQDRIRASLPALQHRRLS